MLFESKGNALTLVWPMTRLVVLPRTGEVQPGLGKAAWVGKLNWAVLRNSSLQQRTPLPHPAARELNTSKIHVALKAAVQGLNLSPTESGM